MPEPRVLNNELSKAARITYEENTRWRCKTDKDKEIPKGKTASLSKIWPIKTKFGSNRETGLSEVKNDQLIDNRRYQKSEKQQSRQEDRLFFKRCGKIKSK